MLHVLLLLLKLLQLMLLVILLLIMLLLLLLLLLRLKRCRCCTASTLGLLLLIVVLFAEASTETMGRGRNDLRCAPAARQRRQGAVAASTTAGVTAAIATCSAIVSHVADCSAIVSHVAIAAVLSEPCGLQSQRRALCRACNASGLLPLPLLMLLLPPPPPLLPDKTLLPVPRLLLMPVFDFQVDGVNLLFIAPKTRKSKNEQP